MNGGNSAPTNMLENSIKFYIHTYLFEEDGVERRRVQEHTFLRELVRVLLPITLQVDEGGVGFVDGVAGERLPFILRWLTLLCRSTRAGSPARATTSPE